MYILGLSTMTESSAALMLDGELIAAAEEERFSRVKHDGGFPHRAIAAVLDKAGIGVADVDHVAIYWNPFKLGHRLLYLGDLLKSNPKLFARKLGRSLNVWRGSHAGEGGGWGSLFRVRQHFSRYFKHVPAHVHFMDHHLTHMAAAYYGSGFDDAAILIMDGAGEDACTTSAVGRGNRMEVLETHLLPHSLGQYYSAITGYLGFKMLDGEYKLMGLSPYGDPSGANWIRENFLQPSGNGRYVLNPRALDYHSALQGDFSGTFADHFGPPRKNDEDAPFTDRHRDIAAAAQRAFEEAVRDLAEQLRRRTDAKKIVVAGGCGLNCVANGKLLSWGLFDEVYVPPVPHDAGGALGAAMVMHERLTGTRPKPIQHAQFGPTFSDSDVRLALEARPELVASALDEDALIARAADKLANGQVVCWVQGPMEYGPRALGNRSFLADPRSDGIRDVMNAKIKKRELFRPFAPSVKEEAASDYFEIDQPSPFMTLIVPVRADKRGVIPAVTHIDGTARPQTVARDINPRYWKLLDAFEQRTGVPVLLNTSFNIQEPIVCTPREAFDTFLRSSTDGIAIGNFWVERS